MSTSPQFNVRVLPNTVIGQAAINLAPYSWSAPLAVPSLGQTVARLDPDNASGTGFPDTAGDTAVNGYSGNDGTRAWSWGSQFQWDTVTQRAIGINSPHPGVALGNAENGYLTLLSLYDAASNAFVIMESPFWNGDASWPRSVAHLFDNQCIAGRVLYKATYPVWREGQGYLQPQIAKVNLDALTTDMTSGREGAAYLGAIALPDNDTTAGALAYLPGSDSLVHLHKSRVWFMPRTTEVWGPEIQLGFPVTNAFHNLGHYHPQAGKFRSGGGAYFGTETFNTAWVSIDGTTQAITRIDDSPVVLSVSETNIPGPGEVKASGCFDPNSSESIFFHDNLNVYGLDDTRPVGSHWRVLGTAPVEADWVCAMPTYGCILVGTSAAAGGATLRLYRGA